MKTFLLLMMSVAALSLNAQVYTEYFTETDPQPDGTPGVAFSPGDELETGDATVEGYYGWYLSAKSTNRETGPDGQASPLISSEDALFFGDYIGDEQGQAVKYDSAVAYGSDQRDNFWVVNDGAGDTLKLDTVIGTIYTAFLFKPLANSKDSYRDFFGYEWSATNNTSRGRVFMNLQGEDVIFGVSRNKTKVADGLDTVTVANAVDQTFLMVMKYESTDGNKDNKNDTVRLYIDPNPLLSEAEQTGIALRGTDGQSDRSHGTIVRLRIRQKGMNALIGGIRVGTDWKEVLQGLAVTGVSLDQNTLTIDAGATGTLVATVAPEGAGDPSVTWSSSDETVATVADGVVTGVAEGTADIIVTTTDGSFTDTCAVTVNAGGTGVNDIEITGSIIYPNPSNGNLTIANAVGADVSIYNIAGSIVYQQLNVGTEKLNISNLSKGIYIVNVSTGDVNNISKLIVE